MLKAITLCLFQLFIFFPVSAQYKYIYYLDQNLASVPQDSAVIIGKALPDGDLIQVNCYNKKSGKIVMRLHFTDSTLSTLHGTSQSFYETGMLDTEGNYINGLESGLWISSNESGLITDSSFFENGRLIMQGKYDYHFDTLTNYEFKDSKTSKYLHVRYNNNGTKSEEAEFIGDTGVYSFYEKGIKTTQPVFTRSNSSAEFPGGIKKLNEYIYRELRAHKATNVPIGHYDILFTFDIDKKGKLINVRSDYSMGFSFDNEMLRIFENSPPWIPAKHYGVPVKSSSSYRLKYTINPRMN